MNAGNSAAKKKQAVDQKVKALVPDLWDYVKENCRSLEAWKHEKKIFQWAINAVGGVYQKELAKAQLKLIAEKKKSDALKTKLQDLRALNARLNKRIKEAARGNK